MWMTSELVGVVADEIREAEDRLRQEQAVLGLDALTEVELHPIVQSGLQRTGLVVLREQAYPGAYARRPLPRDRERCDLVVLPEGSDRLLDPLVMLREAEERAVTLFSEASQPGLEPGALPEDAYWIEVKSVAQVSFVEGVPVGNPSYGSQLVRGPAVDLAKLAREPMVSAGGVLVLLFAEDAAVARHDLGEMVNALLGRDLPIRSPEIEFVEIADRAGNACVGVCLVPLRVVRDSVGEAM